MDGFNFLVVTRSCIRLQQKTLSFINPSVLFPLQFCKALSQLDTQIQLPTIGVHFSDQTPEPAHPHISLLWSHFTVILVILVTIQSS